MTLPFLNYFLNVVWILVVIAGTPVVVLENCVTLEMHTTQALGGSAPDLFQWERKNQVYLSKVMVVSVFCNMHPNFILKLLCV